MPIIFEFDAEAHAKFGCGLRSPVYSWYSQWKRDNDYYRSFHKWAEENVVVGRKVWRGEWTEVGKFEIREGEITKIERVRFNDVYPYRDTADPNGDSLRWYAKFLRPSLVSSDHYSQTSDGHEFFSTRELAVKNLIREMTSKLEDCVRDQIKWEQAIKKLQTDDSTDKAMR